MCAVRVTGFPPTGGWCQVNDACLAGLCVFFSRFLSRLRESAVIEVSKPLGVWTHSIKPEEPSNRWTGRERLTCCCLTHSLALSTSVPNTPPAFQVTLSIRCNRCCCSRLPVPYLAALLISAWALAMQKALHLHRWNICGSVTKICLLFVAPPRFPINSTQCPCVNATVKAINHAESFHTGLH